MNDRMEDAQILAYEQGHRDGCKQGSAGLDDIVKGLEDEIARLKARLEPIDPRQAWEDWPGNAPMPPSAFKLPSASDVSDEAYAKGTAVQELGERYRGER